MTDCETWVVSRIFWTKVTKAGVTISWCGVVVEGAG